MPTRSSKRHVAAARGAARALAVLAGAALVLGACGQDAAPPAPGPADTAAPTAADTARELVTRNLDASLGTANYDLLIVMSEGQNVVSLHRPAEPGGPYEVLTISKLEGGRLTSPSRWATTQKPNTEPETGIYASTGNSSPEIVEANRRLITTMYHDVIDLRKPDAPARYIAEDYIQHNPMVSQGRAGIEGFIQRMGPAPEGASSRRDDLVVADGELVLLVSDLGGGRRIADLFRVEGGMVAEHWDFTPTA